MKERNYKLDIIRIVACLMVILRHSPNPDSGLNGMICSGIGLLTDPCVILFFMVSGALLLPVRLSYKDFLTRRLGKVVWPTLFFTALYLLVGTINGEYTIPELLKAIISIPFSQQGSGILWFMYTMIGLYLVTPIISPFIEKASKKELQFVLLVWFVTLCWPLLSLIVDVRTDNESMLHVFSGYTGYFLLGYYLRKYPIKLNLFVGAVMLVVPFVAYLAAKVLGFNFDFDTQFGYLTVFAALMSFVWYSVLSGAKLSLSDKTKKIIVDFSNCSFGIYLIHIFIMRRIIWNVESLQVLPSIVQLMVTFILTIVLSWGTINVVSRFRFSNYIIGYKRNKNI